MKKNVMALLVLSMLVLSTISPVFAAIDVCSISASLVNQDPYPAVPGEQVKLVFQVDGIDDPSCGKVDFTLLEAFPIRIESGTDPTTSIKAGVFVRTFENFFLAPYKVIISEDVLDGEYQIEALIKTDISEKVEEFTITVEDTNADFEVSVKDYDTSQRELTFEILNIAENDIESLTIQIEKQDNIVVKGSNRNIVGSLDSNEDTTFSFEATPKDGDIVLNIYYTDTTGVRRNIAKTVQYDSSYFTDRARDQNGSSSGVYWVVGIVVVLLIWFFFFRKKKHKIHHKHAHHASHHKKN
jgi:hypothetical protein